MSYSNELSKRTEKEINKSELKDYLETSEFKSITKRRKNILDKCT